MDATVAAHACRADQFLAVAGRIGHLFVNISEKTQPLAVSLDTRNLPAAGTYDVEVYRSTAGPAFQPLWQKAKLPREYRTDLAPLEAVFVELSAGGRK